MQKDSFAKRFGALLRGSGILKRGLDRVCQGRHDVGRKQRVGMRPKNFRYTADVRGYHGHSRSGRLDRDIGHGILAGWYHQQAALGEGVSRLDVADEAHGLRKTQPLHLSLEICELLALTGKRQRDRASVGVQPRYSIDKEVSTFDVPEFAYIDDVGGVLSFDDRIEFVRSNAIEHTTHQSGRDADCALIGIAREGAFEQEQVRHVHKGAFDTAVQCAL
jgi:hypothetical protein